MRETERSEESQADRDTERLTQRQRKTTKGHAERDTHAEDRRDLQTREQSEACRKRCRQRHRETTERDNDMDRNRHTCRVTGRDTEGDKETERRKQRKGKRLTAGQTETDGKTDATELVTGKTCKAVRCRGTWRSGTQGLGQGWLVRGKTAEAGLSPKDGSPPQAWGGSQWVTGIAGKQRLWR